MQLMQLYVQKSTRTTFPLSSLIDSGGELIHAVIPAIGAAGAIDGSSPVCTGLRFPFFRFKRRGPAQMVQFFLQPRIAFELDARDIIDNGLLKAASQLNAKARAVNIISAPKICLILSYI